MENLPGSECMMLNLDPARGDDLQASSGHLVKPESEDATREVKVLVVDDDPEMALLLQAMLPAQRYTLLSAYDGQEGLEMAHDEQPRAILLDLMLPGMSGFEVLEKLRADPVTAGIPVIVLTAKNVTPDERSLLEDHVQGVICKTALSPQSLLAQLRRLGGCASAPTGGKLGGGG